MLLVLDNCEQVLDAAADVAALLVACPHLAILATSRIPLHIRAERDVAVPPLSLPDPERLPPLAELAQVAAVALFVERARAARADFALTHGERWRCRRRSASVWMACPWRSSWPRRGSNCCRRPHF